MAHERLAYLLLKTKLPPWTEGLLLSVVARARMRRGLEVDMHARAPVGVSPGVMTLLVEGSSPAMQAILEVVRNIAGTEVPVLLVGESGTGKEAIAWRIWVRSTERASWRSATPCARMWPARPASVSIPCWCSAASMPRNWPEQQTEERIHGGAIR